MIRSTRVLAATLTVWCVSSVPVRAQGSGLYEQGACMMGRAGAGVAAPCRDGSAGFFNPAGLTLETEPVVGLGATAIAPRGSFTDSASHLVSALNERTFAAPSGYAVFPIGRRVVIGAGLFAPYALTIDWPSTSEGRFIAYKSEIRSVYIQPTVAVRLNDRASVGAGFDVTHSSVELRRRVDLAGAALPGAPPGVTFQAIGVPPATDFADVALTGAGTSFGAHVGVLVTVNDGVSLGARYLARQHVNANDGQLTTTQIATGLLLRAPLPGIPAGTPVDRIVAPAFAAGQALGPQSATTTVPLPDQLVIGVALRANERLQVLADYQFTAWSLFDQIVIQNQFGPPTIIEENGSDTHGLRLGVEYDLGHRAAIRGGFDAHTASAPDQSVTPILPEAPRREWAIGASVPLAARFRVDLAYQFAGQSDRAGRTTDTTSNNGVYRYNANLFGASLVMGW